MISRHGGRRAVILDVDGVIAPVGDTGTAWGDDVVAGDVFGPVLVSPALCARLEELGRVPGVSAWWLTSWSVGMRATMHPFPGQDWPVVASQAEARPERNWWKLAALDVWLDAHQEVTAIAWCDDHLLGSRPAAVRRRLTPRGVEALIIAPRTEIGLTPAHMGQLEVWATS